MTQIQATLRKRILRAFVGRGLLASFEAKEMLGYQHSEHGSGKRGAKADELHLTPLELIDRIAALLPQHAPTGIAILACWPRIRRTEQR